MERRGIRTVRGDMNREIRQLRARIIKLGKWIAEESKNITPPMLYDVVLGILNRRGKYGLQDAAQMLIFLQQNKIPDLAGLEKKVSSMNSNFQGVQENLKKVERRIKTLDDHLMHSDNFKNYRKVKSRYDKLYSEYRIAKKETRFFAERKAQKALDAANEYHEAHRPELAMYDNAEEYLRGVLQGRFDPKKLPPITMWQNERINKIAEMDALYREYKVLKDEVKKVEQIKRSVADILRSDAPEKGRTRARGVAL